MASLFGHGILAYTISRVIDRKALKRLTLLAIISSIFPDIDVIAFKFGIPYEHVFGHRGFTHSLLFACLLMVFTINPSFYKTKTTHLFLSVVYINILSWNLRRHDFWRKRCWFFNSI